MSTKEPIIANIIMQYNPLLLRYATRCLKNKHMGTAVVKEVFESLYEQNKLQPGPRLRCHLKKATASICQSIDQSIERANQVLTVNPAKNDPSQN